MAGDVPADERALITPAEETGQPVQTVFTASDATTAGAEGPDGPGGPDAPPPEAPQAGERPLHRYGRVQVLGRPRLGSDADGTGARAGGGNGSGAGGGNGGNGGNGGAGLLPLADGSVVSTAGVSPGLNRTETLGLDAFRLRASTAFRRVKEARPRDGRPWDMDRPCTDVPPPRGSSSPAEPPERPALRAQANGRASGQADAPETPSAVSGAAAAHAPTSAALEGSVAIGLVLVEGPTANLQLTAAERTKIVAEVQNGLSWYATTNPAADLTFHYDIQIVRLSVPPNPAASDLEALWRDPTMSRLGYAANFDGVYDYVEALRSRLGTTSAYCAFFTKYPLSYFAYSSIGGPRIVMSYDNDGWGPDNIDRVFTHESGHIFGAPDEYQGAGCDCGGQWGAFKAPNGNCDGCAPAPVDCLMRSNSFALCRYTPSHIGWGHGVRGNPVLVQVKGLGNVGNFDVVVPSTFAGLTHVWRDNDAPGYPWQAPWKTAQELGPIDAVTMVQSTLANPGPLEVTIRAGSTLYFLWRDSSGAFAWHPATRLLSGVGGVPSLVQSRLGTKGNFELLVPSADVGLLHLWRNHDVYGYPWSAPKLFGANLGTVDAVSLIHGTLGGGAGWLEAVARVGSRLVHLTRDDSAVWRTGPVFADGVAGNPALIQSTFPGARNFEVVVPSAGTGLIHYYRNNSAEAPYWSGPRPFGAELGKVDAVTMIQSNFDGHLEVIARVSDRLYMIWRSSGAGATWSVPRHIF